MTKLILAILEAIAKIAGWWADTYRERKREALHKRIEKLEDENRKAVAARNMRRVDELRAELLRLRELEKTLADK